MKSCIELADELKVSKQTIFNHIKALNIETVKVKNTKYIKEEQDIKRIIERIENKSSSKYFDKVESEFDNLSNKFVKPVMNFDEPSRVAIEKMYKLLEDENQQRKEETLSNHFDNFSNDFVKVEESLSKQIATLTKQVERDNEQLREKDKQIERLSRLLENQQILSLESQKKIKELEQQIKNPQFNEEKKLSNHTNESQKQKISFSSAIFRRIFK